MQILVVGGRLATPAVEAYLTGVLPWSAEMTSADGKHTTTLSTKGQFILPKAIRDRRHWPAGTRLIVEDTPDGVLLNREPVFALATIDAVFGSLSHDGPARSLEDMDAAIMAEAKRRARD